MEGSDTAANDDFGCSVAISGSTAVVGADGQNGRQCRPCDRG
ncbi:MAG: FG-GAP repeat protein [Acidimicrobiales bacterium]